MTNSQESTAGIVDGQVGDADRQTISPERADLLQSLAKHRYFLRYPMRDLTDEQAGLRTTASELCLGGLIKHVTAIEEQWMDFAVRGTVAMEQGADWSYDDWANQFAMTPSDTLAALLTRYEQVAAKTDALVATLDLDVAYPLPPAPWFEPGASWSVRRVILHVLAETAQHAGHADILRETLDGAKSMG
ncbi:MAG: DinB family protein [Nakamurella sp.]